jgi:hypothetical protein
MPDLRDRLLRVFAGIAKDGVTGVSGVTAASPPKSAGYTGYTGHTGYTPADTTRVTEEASKVVTPATDREKVAVGEVGKGVPAEWAKRIALLKSGEPRLGMTPLHWSQFVRDARRFLAEWGAEAARLGWSAEDIFGVHPLAPEARYDVMGILPLIRGNEVVAISEHRAIICTPGGGHMTYYRHRPNSGAVAVWELLQ